MKNRIGIILLLVIAQGATICLLRLGKWNSVFLIALSGLSIRWFCRLGKKRQQTERERGKLSAALEGYLVSLKKQGYGSPEADGSPDIWKGEEKAALCHDRRLCLIYQLSCRVARDGSGEGGAGGIADFLLKELAAWKQRASRYQKERSLSEKKMLLEWIGSVLLCSLPRLFLPPDLMETLENTTIYRGSAFLVFLLFFLLAHAAFFVCAHGGKRSGEPIEEAIEEPFFYWLLSVALYLGHDSVYCAIRQSLSGEDWESGFDSEVRKLLDGIYEQPDSPIPYRDFLADVDIPQVRIGMELLSSAGNADGHDVCRRMVSFVEQNHGRLDKMEEQRWQRSLSGFRFAEQAFPVIAGSKILWDAFAFIFLQGGLT